MFPHYLFQICLWHFEDSVSHSYIFGYVSWEFIYVPHMDTLPKGITCDTSHPTQHADTVSSNEPWNIWKVCSEDRYDHQEKVYDFKNSVTINCKLSDFPTPRTSVFKTYQFRIACDVLHVCILLSTISK